VFTGLISDLGSVSALALGADGATLAVRTQLARELGKGDSLAVNGVCLSASAVEDGTVRADVMRETLARSALGTLRPGDAVNLELPLRAGDRLGGHVVQGHVDGTGTVSAVGEEGIARVLSIDIEPALARYLVHKGSVAVDGVSLTVSALGERGFSVSLIPETLRRTSLGRLAPGALVNIEVDVLAKHLERLLASAPAANAAGEGR
jgi:riboflavin synthase